MFLLGIIRFLLGTIRFSVDGGYPEKFLSLAAFTGVRMWNIRRKGSAITASTLKKNNQKLLSAAKRSGVTLHIDNQKGAPYLLNRYHRRAGVFIGLVILLITVWFFASFIWTVQVTGNSATPSDEITEVLNDLGMKAGAFPLMLNLKDIEQKAMTKLPGLAWMHIEMRGTTAVVKVRERVYPPDISPELPCNVVASQTGQIVKIQPYEGKAMVRVGDTIPQGGLLVSGVIDCQNGVVRFVHARASVTALVKRDLTVSVPYKQTVRLPTGKESSLYTIKLFTTEIPLYWSKPGGDSNRSVYDNWMNVFGVRLPIGVSTNVYRFVEVKQQTVSKEQAYDQAMKKLAAEEGVQLSGVQIKSRQIESKPDGSGYTLIGHYLCQQEIAVQQEIQIS